MITRKQRTLDYLNRLLGEAVEYFEEDEYSLKDLRDIITYWEMQPEETHPLTSPTRKDVMRAEIAGLKNEVLRRQGKQPWDWRDGGRDI